MFSANAGSVRSVRSIGSVDVGRGGRGEGKKNVPPFSMPFTAAPEMVLSIVFAASLMASTGLLRAMGVVLKRRAWRAIC